MPVVHVKFIPVKYAGRINPGLWIHVGRRKYPVCFEWTAFEDRKGMYTDQVEMSFYDPKFFDRQVLANSLDHDQTAPERGIFYYAVFSFNSLSVKISDNRKNMKNFKNCCTWSCILQFE